VSKEAPPHIVENLNTHQTRHYKTCQQNRIKKMFSLHSWDCI
jgi:hypothetical protein